MGLFPQKTQNFYIFSALPVELTRNPHFRTVKGGACASARFEIFDFKVLFGTKPRTNGLFRGFWGIFVVFTRVVVHLTPTASAAALGYKIMQA